MRTQGQGTLPITRMIFIVIALLILFGLIAVQDFFLGVLIVVGLLPSYLIRFNIIGIPTTFLECMVLILITMWLIRSIPRLYKEGVRGWSDNRIVIPIILLLLAATIGIFVSPDKHAALGVYKAFYLEPILFFFLIIDVLKKQTGTISTVPYEQIKAKIFRALGAGSLIVSLFAIIQWIFGIGIPSPWDLERRITSIFDYPNALALFLGPIIVLSFFEFQRHFSPPSQGGIGGGRAVKRFTSWSWFWLLTGSLGLINVILAQSEASWIALVATFFLFVVVKFFESFRDRVRGVGTPPITRFIFIVPIIFIACVIVIIPFRNYALEKLTLNDSSGHVRISQWTETIALLKDHPIFGAGLSGYPIALKPYHKNISLEIFQYPHNFILNIWVELGLLGLVAFGLLAWRIIRMCKNDCARDGRNRPLHAIPTNAIPFIFFEMTIHGLVDVPYFKNDLALLTWILLAVFIADYAHTKSSQTKTGKRA